MHRIPLNYFRRGVAVCALCLPLVLVGSPQSLQAQTVVTVSTVEARQFAERVDALGTLQANESVEITSTLTDHVTAIHFDDGQRVAAGDVLLEMTSAEEQAQLTEAESAFREAEKQFKRSETLLAQQVVSASVVDERRREYEVARARLRAIESRLQDLRIAAPFAGVLGMRRVSKGALLQPGDVITTIDDDSVMKLDFSVPAIHLAALKEGQAVRASSSAYPSKVFEGTIRNINSRVDPVTRAVLVRALIPNEERLLRPGMLMHVEVIQKEHAGLSIPEEAIVSEGSEHHVFRLRSEGEEIKVERAQVSLGIREPGIVEIRKGLQAGDRVVRDGTLKIHDGSPVSIKDAERKSSTESEPS